MGEEKTTRSVQSKDIDRTAPYGKKKLKKCPKWIFQTPSRRKRSPLPKRVITGSKKIVFRAELNPDGGYKREKGSGFQLGESGTAEVTPRIDRRLPRASHRWAR